MKVIVSVSGGKDSTACLLLALAEYPKDKIICIFNDTGWEHPLTYEYLIYLQETFSLEFVYTSGAPRRDGTPQSTLEEIILSKGKFPSGAYRFCTSHLKLLPTAKWLNQNFLEICEGAELWFGIRQNESISRQKRYANRVADEVYELRDVFGHSYSNAVCEVVKVRFPILDWEEQEVFEFIEASGLEVNPLYSESTSNRVGCYPCMLSGKKNQQAQLATEYGKGQLERIRVLEQHTNQKYRPVDTDTSCMFCQV